MLKSAAPPGADVGAKLSTTSAGSTVPLISGVVATVTNTPSAAEKNKQWQRELLMERIRSHSTQHKTFAELSKAMRMSMLEKRYALDAVEKANLQKCLDSMQHCIKVTSRQGLVERLESLSRQLGLKFMEDKSGLFISTDMFFLEIILDASGALTDVKVHHECKIEQQSCSELVNCLNRGDFADFTVQLEGLSSIYQLNAEPKVKTKAFVALQAMETDLYQLYQSQNFSKDTQQMIVDSSVGLVLQRRGGHPMRLTYFVGPYDLISLETRTLQPLSLELITSQQLGLSVTVNLEASSANKLQILPTITFSNDGASTEISALTTPIYAPLTQENSMLLPATFVLRLNKPLPVCNSTLRALGLTATLSGDSSAAVDSTTSKAAAAAPAVTIMNLIVQTASEQQLRNSRKGLFVCLPDQTHCYFFTDNKKLKASLVSSVPFTEPSQVPKILDFLKKQALFYTLLSSCVRLQSKMGNDMDMTTILEVNAISFQQISVSLQHPYEESMATLEFDLRNGRVNCTIFSFSRNYELLSLKLTSIVQKSLSIPMTIRSLLKYWDQERMKMFQLSIGGVGGGPPSASQGSGGGGFGNFNMAMGANDPGGGGENGTPNSGAIGGGVGTIKSEQSARHVGIAAAVPQTATTATAAPTNAGTVSASFFKYKSDVKQEDFHESPKSQTQSTNAMTTQFAEAPAAAVASSLGYKQQQPLQKQQKQQQEQQKQQQPQQTSVKASDIEIADKYKNIWKDKTASLKNCVSITPISSEPPPPPHVTKATGGLDVKRTGSIEIIPLSAAHTVNASIATPVTTASIAAASTITITPINANIAPQSAASIVGREKKPASSISTASTSTTGKREATADCTGQPKEKKRKKKRDDSPMGPPEKVYSRQNSPAALADAAAVVAAARKFSSPASSPKSSSGGGASAAAAAAGSTRPSPKHSPVYSSPKHQSGGGGTASNSPKSPFGTHSPKHGSSGKPSMSTLKSAAAGDKSGAAINLTASGASGSSVVAATAALVRTLSGSAVGVTGAGSSTAASPAKTSRSGIIDGSGNKEKASAIAAPISAVKLATSSSSMGVAAAAAAGLQQLKSVASLNHLAAASGGVGSLSAFSSAAAATGAAMDLGLAAAAMRKGVAAAGAVSLMTSTEATAAIATSTLTATTTTHQPSIHPALQHQLPVGNNETSTVDGGSNTSAQLTISSSSSSSSEYMVKSSQEGLKLTINKTSNKSSAATTSKTKNSASSTNSSSSNKKQHTGLKPGVNSGPASKKSPATPTSPSNSTSGTFTASFSSSSFAKTFATSTTSAFSSSSSSSSSLSSQSAKHIFQKSNSSGNLSAKLSTAGGGNSHGLSRSNSANFFAGGNATGVSNKKSSSSSSNTIGGGCGGSSAPPTRFDHHADMMKILQYASPTMAASMEGFMKGLNAKFQIPKLSQRATSAATISGGAATTTAAAAATTTTAINAFKNNTAGVAALNQSHQQQQPTAHKLKEKKSSTPYSANAAATNPSRSPPPPYHAAIAASCSLQQPTRTLSTSTTSESSSSMSSSSNSMHTLKSSSLPPTALLGSITGSEQQQQRKQQQQQQAQSLADYKHHLPNVDEALLASFAGK